MQYLILMNIGKNKMIIKFKPTIIQKIDDYLWIKREDLIPFSFGGNKARKAFLFFQNLDIGDYDCVVTYGSSSSNHCRVIANICAQRKIDCYIVSPLESSKTTNNSRLIKFFKAKIIFAPVQEVHDTIENLLMDLKHSGKKPYFIQGGGHGNIGTQAYVDCYNEIVTWERENKTYFDYIFVATGTGTTQAGLVCGSILNNENAKIIGISIARNKNRGKKIVIDSIRDYLKTDSNFDDKVIFIDDYICNGYGKSNEKIKQTIEFAMSQYGIPLDSTYTGKAFYGMMEYIKKERIIGKSILFIHTGGTPLFFDDLKD